jgi:TRAP-type transport system periplasmic protein
MALHRRTLLKSAVLATVSAPFVARRGLAAAKYSLKLVYPDTPQHPFMQVALRFADALRAKTDGAVDVQVFTTGQLGTQVNMLTGLQSGIIELCFHTSGFVQTLFPKIMAIDLPFLFADSSAAERVLDGPVGKSLFDDFPAKGIYGLSYGHFGWRVVSTVDRAIPTPDLIKGLKIRVQPGAIYAAMFKELQANPVAVDLSEVYLALSQHAVDAIETPMISVAASKHDEVVKVINLTNHVYNPGIMMVSKRKMDAMEKPYQDAIREASLDMTADCRKTIATASDETAARFKAKGLKIVDVDRKAYRAAVEPVYKQFRDTVGPALFDSVVAQAS